MPGRPGIRGPGRVPVGVGPRRCSNGRFAGEPPGPPGLGVYCRPCPPGCIGRIGWPGRGPPLRCPLPGVVPGSGPRFPVGNGREGAVGRAPGAPDAAAAGRTAGCVPGVAPVRGLDVPPGRCALGAPVGCAAGACGRSGALAGGFAGAGAAGAAGLAIGVGPLGAPAGGVLGTLGPGVAAGAAAVAGAAGVGGGAAGFAAGATDGATCGVFGAAGAGFAATPGAAATGAGGAAGRILAALAAASLASLSALAAASAAASSSACPEIFLRTFSATSAGIELECVFFSVTPYPGKRSMIALALTSSSRASSLIRT